MLLIAPGQRIGTRTAGDRPPSASDADLAEWLKIGVLMEVPDPPAASAEDASGAPMLGREAVAALLARAAPAPAAPNPKLEAARNVPTIKRLGRRGR